LYCQAGLPKDNHNPNHVHHMDAVEELSDSEDDDSEQEDEDEEDGFGGSHDQVFFGILWHSLVFIGVP
jgi:hypothetical protein